MNVTNAVASRISCRAFLDKPVEKQILVEILETAKRAPSGGNLQPWLVHVLAGQPLAEFLAAIRSKRSMLPVGEGTEYNIYPPELHDPYRARRFKCGEDLYATIGVPRDNKLARIRQFSRNYEFFGAPVGLFFCIDRRMGQDQWADLGMFMQTVMLLARERGLHTCAQEAWAIWHKTIAEFLRLPPDVMLFSGMALGYMDESAPINSLRTERAALDDFATLQGFET
ncbi:NADH dehydrogenase [Steroidobacter agaridevorans]|uniref:NADH dehydrogenase n=1 Tax=Steroidobacter agaridevorans TaxID=2695856 RepID=A0A829YDZ0_9GAMM|nr:nitroreductase [Steroidobacter agaridevorans]GFE81031.1 NADH dehydrogenase [Steroidobacter agaridevorans]